MHGRREREPMSEFELGDPALVCRWRLSHRHLPLENRHLKALLARVVAGTPVSQALVAWAKQHIEWTLEAGAANDPSGTLMLLVDAEGRAAMSVGPYEPLADATLAGLVRRAMEAQREAVSTGVAPESLWLVHEGRFMWNLAEGCAPSGASSLVAQLAQTLGVEVVTRADLLGVLSAGEVAFEEAFLVSDEHGVTLAQDASGPLGRRMAEGYQRLLKHA